jgi:DNA polymerase-3 subunit alpha
MLEGILKPTNGVFLYQEQVMKSAQVITNSKTNPIGISHHP